MLRLTTLIALAYMLLQAQTAPRPGAAPADLSKRGIGRDTLKGKVTSDSVPRGYAVIIGIVKYPNLGPENNKLQFTERDARFIRDVLVSQEAGNFPPENVHELIGAKATLANIRHEIEEWLPSVAKESDRVLIYFAGHGFLKEDGSGYLAPYDVDLKRLDQTAYSMTQLGQVFGNKIAAKWKVLLTDACHSGAITPQTTNEGLNAKLSNVSRNVLSFTASRKQESSFEDPKLGDGHGLFTYFLHEGLTGQADRDHDGVVSADELIDYVRNHVREYALQRSQHQTPTESGDFDSELILAFNPKRAASPDSGLAAQDGTLIVETNMDDVEVFLDDQPKGRVSKDQPRTLYGITPGTHQLQGAKQGYQPDGPNPIVVYPGVPTRVMIRIQFASRPKKSAQNLYNEGLKLYNRGQVADTKRAAELFEKALQEDPKYSEAAMYLGRTYQVQFDTPNAIKYLDMAIKLDPDLAPAYVSLGAALLDSGDTRRAVTTLNYAAEHDGKNSYVHSHLAQAYRMAGAYEKSVEEAQEALKLDRSNAQGMLWLGDSLRALGRFSEARDAYRDYVRVTDFDSTTVEKIGYYLLSNPFTSAFAKKRPTQRQVYMDQRNLGFFGLCNCEHNLGNLSRAEAFCRTALTYDAQDPFSYYELGRVSLEIYNSKPNREKLLDAKQCFEKMLALNSEMAEANTARGYLRAIEQKLQKLSRVN